MNTWEVEYETCCRTQRGMNGLPRSERYYQAEAALRPRFIGYQERLIRLVMETDGDNLAGHLEAIIRLEAQLVHIIRMLSLFEDEDFVYEEMIAEVERHALEDYWLGLEYKDEMNDFKLLGFIAEDKMNIWGNGR